ncbi:telomere stability and silencing-domain-containing protein [Delphinella strobiligena]|nr:telomere stability and silencing-domain-containing protein [Delphinella strobiligena]
MAKSGVVNVFIQGFEGLGLPKQLCINLSTASTISELFDHVRDRLHTNPNRSADKPDLPIYITSSTRKVVRPNDASPISDLLSYPFLGTDRRSHMLTLRIHTPTLGGKGGFGSQLRAAGGRMSSRKNKRNAEQQNGSNRNLDGRRLRTITEAKNLATYLATKPDMDKKEKEERRKRWEAVVEAAERKEEEIKRGKGGNVRLDGQWVEQKEEVESKTRDAVLAAMKAGLIGNEASMLERTGSESSASGDDADSDEIREGEASSSSAGSAGEEEQRPATTKFASTSVAPVSRTFFGWDEDDEDMSDEEDEPAPVAYEGKGKGKA